MAEDIIKQDEITSAENSAGTVAAADDEYEYEYIELEEGEELPEGVEYEYIEVPADEGISEEVINETMHTEPNPVPEVMPAPVVEAEPVTASEPMSAPVVEVESATASESMSAPVVESEPVTASEPMPTPVIAEPILSVPPVKTPTVEASPVENINAVETAAPMVNMVQIDEEDLNALLDNDEEIKEIDTSALLTDDSNDEFEKNLFGAPKAENIEEVSIDDILGIEDTVPAADKALDGIEEISMEDLTAETEATETVQEVTPLTEEELLGGTDDQVWLNDDEGQNVAEGVVPAIEPISETVAEAVAKPVVEPNVESKPESVIEAVIEPVVTAPESVTDAVVEPVVTAPESVATPVIEPEVEQEVTALTVEELLGGADDQVWLNDDEGQNVAEGAVPAIEPIPEPVVEETAEPVAESTVEVEPEPVTEAVVEPVTEPTFEPKPESVADAVVEPVVTAPEPVAEAVVEPVVTPVVEPVAAPAVETIPEPKPEPTTVEVTPPVEEAAVVSEAIVSQNNMSAAEPVKAEIKKVKFALEALTQELYVQLSEAGKIISKTGGLQFFEDLSQKGMLLTYEPKELADWNLVIFNQNVLPIDMASKSLELPLEKDSIRYAKVIKNGAEKLVLYNEEKYQFENPEDNFVKAQSHFIYGDADKNTGLIINDYLNISLFDKAGKVITFEKPVSGLICGPQGTVIFFAAVQKIGIAENTQVKEDAEKALLRAAKWYSGTLADKYFEFSASSQAGEFVGTDDIRAIHVNTGNSAYGWNVTFDNGIVMSLKDLQEFQIKHGKLPTENGEIAHGSLKLKFSQVERIVVYQAPQYFAYGKAGN